METTMVFTGLSLLTLLLIPVIMEFFRENMPLIVSLCFMILLWQWVAPGSLPIDRFINSMSALPNAVTHQLTDNAGEFGELTRTLR